MPRAAEDAPFLTIHTRAERRDWLPAHHREPGPVWLAACKRHHPDDLACGPQARELLCGGWTDPVTRALDAGRSMIPIAPDDLPAALDAAGQRAFRDAMPKSVRRGTREWIKTAKTPRTRGKRIGHVVDSAALGLRPSPFRR
jgi:uncharacterized protein YdeI (YjbR/CyaY-like superfamily)